MKTFFTKRVIALFYLCLFCLSVQAETINAGQTIEKPGDYTPSGSLIVNGTLIIHGDLIMGKNSDLTIGDHGILIVLGTLSIVKNVDVKPGGYLIADRVLTYSQGSGTFPPGDKVYINTVDGDPSTDKQDGLSVDNIDPIVDLKTDDPDVWTVFSGALCGVGVSAGSISISDSPALPICGETKSPDIIGTVVDGVTYEWFYSKDAINWNALGVNAKNYSPGVLKETTYFYRQIQKGNGCEKNTSYVEISVTPKPHPIGIFF